VTRVRDESGAGRGGLGGAKPLRDISNSSIMLDRSTPRTVSKGKHEPQESLATGKPRRSTREGDGKGEGEAVGVYGIRDVRVPAPLTAQPTSAVSQALREAQQPICSPPNADTCPLMDPETLLLEKSLEHLAVQLETDKAKAARTQAAKKAFVEGRQPLPTCPEEQAVRAGNSSKAPVIFSPQRAPKSRRAKSLVANQGVSLYASQNIAGAASQVDIQAKVPGPSPRHPLSPSPSLPPPPLPLSPPCPPPPLCPLSPPSF
jgi:hypothetical protein